MSSIIALIAALLVGSGASFGAASGDNGLLVDPNGAKAATVSSRGASTDPDGCPSLGAAASSDAGSQLDPNGKPQR